MQSALIYIDTRYNQLTQFWITLAADERYVLLYANDVCCTVLKFDFARPILFSRWDACIRNVVAQVLHWN